MPQGKGTYGSKVGRPKVKFKKSDAKKMKVRVTKKVIVNAKPKRK